MILDYDLRVIRHFQGTEISPTLGGLFQNPMEIDHEMIQMEQDAVSALELKIALYKAELSMLRKRAARET